MPSSMVSGVPAARRGWSRWRPPAGRCRTPRRARRRRAGTPRRAARSPRPGGSSPRSPSPWLRSTCPGRVPGPFGPSQPQQRDRRLGRDQLAGEHEHERHLATGCPRRSSRSIASAASQRFDELTELVLVEAGECGIAEGDETVDLLLERGNDGPPATRNERALVQRPRAGARSSPAVRSRLDGHAPLDQVVDVLDPPGGERLPGVGAGLVGRGRGRGWPSYGRSAERAPAGGRPRARRTPRAPPCAGAPPPR